jgi:hypothetical protein
LQQTGFGTKRNVLEHRNIPIIKAGTADDVFRHVAERANGRAAERVRVEKAVEVAFLRETEKPCYGKFTVT